MNTPFKVVSAPPWSIGNNDGATRRGNGETEMLVLVIAGAVFASMMLEALLVDLGQIDA
jgi:hypothetical protein